jgi:hypothetical protein
MTRVRCGDGFDSVHSSLEVAGTQSSTLNLRVIMEDYPRIAQVEEVARYHDCETLNGPGVVAPGKLK